MKVVEVSFNDLNNCVQSFLADEEVTANFSIQTYNYRCEFEEVKKGDFVVVNSKSDNLGIAVVVDVYEDTLKNAKKVSIARKHVVCIIDLEKEKSRKLREIRSKYLRGKLEEKKKAMEDIILFEAIAERDPEAKKLLAELKDIKQLN